MPADEGGPGSFLDTRRFVSCKKREDTKVIVAWFKKHFDTALILLLFILLPVWIIFQWLIADSIISSEVNSTLTGIVFMILVAILFISAGWQLRKKDRNIAWVIVLFMPFGIFIYLWLIISPGPRRNCRQ